MFKQNGLSLEQAPPIIVIFRFFFMGALFGILGGVLLLVYQDDIFNESSTGGLTLTHVFTLGVMMSFMFAALFQMLPVIAGVTLTSPIQKANWVQYPLGIGIIALLLAFNFSTHSWLFLVASVLLGGSLLFVVVSMLRGLLLLHHHSASSRGISVALVSLGVLVILALYLTTTLGGYHQGNYYSVIKNAHYSFGLFGWIAVLIISISFQVIEMFYVTPAYPIWMSRYFVYGIGSLLVLSFVFSVIAPMASFIPSSILLLLLSFYAAMTLKRLAQRKRPISDATLWFWRMGMFSLVVSMFCLFIGHFYAAPWIQHYSVLLFASFSLSVVFAMFYKIVPFLTWFHLNAQGYFSAPMMHEVIHPKTAKKHFWIHLGALATMLCGVFMPPFVLLGGLLVILSFGWIGYQIIHAHLLYIKTQKTGEKFTMNV